ncbi:sigma 54-interacting transcriptional regulator [Pendulispora albinea]|uniref:Sigma 54-interacting transcriptional regulator n=1 Tax=Pendulispora albinea TaxID=2741071 RepID=A0ABZ2M3V9_9BACT
MIPSLRELYPQMKAPAQPDLRATPSNDVKQVEARYVIVVHLAGPLGDLVETALRVEPRFCVVRADARLRAPRHVHLVVVDERMSARRRARLVRACRAPIFNLERHLGPRFDVRELRALILATCSYGDITTENMVAETPTTRVALHFIERIAEQPTPVLVWGPSGSGKKMLARRLHSLSRRKGPFIVAPATDGDLLEAVSTARGGTLCLDEISAVTAENARYIRALCAERRLEGPHPLALSDVRVVATTCRDLAADVVRKLFPADLYLRLASFVVPLFALRERHADLDALIDRFWKQHPRAELVSLSPPARDVLRRYKWPMNVRQLQSVVGQILALAPPGEMSVATLLSLAPEVAQRRGNAVQTGHRARSH